MHILEVTFSNLNSLRGKFRIDFTAPGLAGRGVFLAWGPTGAGKTTIFDAVCLALYGRTPRLAAVNKTRNDIMSKDAKDCLAEARFEAGGAVYRARFAQKRTNKGNLGEVERVIYDAAGGAVAEGIRPCDQKITELTGLQAEQFMQTVMLPQGGFADFLQASPTERAPILARLTKAGEYERISAKVHALYGERQKKVDECQARIKGMAVALLSPEEAAAKEDELQAGKARERGLKTEIAALDAAVKRAEEEAKLRERRGALDRESEALQEAESAFAPKGERLERHLRAEKIAPAWAAFDAAAKRLEDERADLARQEKEFPEKQKDETTTAAAAELAEKNVIAAEQAEKDAAPALADADKLQEERGALARDRERLAEEWKAKDKTRQDAQTRKNEAEAALNNAETKLAALAPPPAADAYARALAALAPDAVREEEARERQAQDAWARAAEALRVAAGARDALPPLNEKLNDATAKATDLTMRLQGARALTAERRKTHDAARESLTNAELAAKYAADRAGLREGEPCPLCGAAHHPLAGQSNEEAEERRGAAQKRWQEAQAALAESESAERGLDRELASADSDKRHAEEALAEAKRTWNEAWQKVEPALKAAGGSAPAEEGLAETLAAAEGEAQRHAARLAAATRQAKFAMERAQLANARDLAAQASAAAAQTWKQADEEANAIAEQGKDTRTRLDETDNKLRAALAPWPGAATPADARAQLRAAIDTARTTASKAQLTAASAQQARKELGEAIRATREKIEAIANNAKETATAFNQALAAGGFASAEEFAAARLGEEAAAELTREREALADRRTALATNEKEWQTEAQKLAAAPALAYTGPLAEAKTRRDSANAALDALLRQNGGLEKEIAANRSAQEKSAAAARELAELQAEAGRWEELDDLIGGDAKTNRFGRYAQQITVRQLVALANRELTRLSPRYELRAGDEDNEDKKGKKGKEEAGLALLIYDQYAGGQLRPVNTLSGGENFLVSLALALALAALGGGEGQVDSLFLDEGFGTLDAETLDTALDALAKLHGAGRMIGVISHVAGLRERLPSQIEVRPRGGGWSEVFVNGASAAAKD